MSEVCVLELVLQFDDERRCGHAQLSRFLDRCETDADRREFLKRLEDLDFAQACARENKRVLGQVVAGHARAEFRFVPGGPRLTATDGSRAATD